MRVSARQGDRSFLADCRGMHLDGVLMRDDVARKQPESKGRADHSHLILRWFAPIDRSTAEPEPNCSSVGIDGLHYEQDV
jgi:hypothetical protein